uniref:Uncharacterized protein n=1 Tax=Arundo donax TaxID=35708 RepID=A0A0A9HDZ2_ARUDO
MVQQLQIGTSCTAVAICSMKLSDRQKWVPSFTAGTNVACKFDVLQLIRTLLWLIALAPYTLCKDPIETLRVDASQHDAVAVCTRYIFSRVIELAGKIPINVGFQI